MPFWTKSAKALTKEIPESPEAEVDQDVTDDVSYDYEEPERGPFDFPHRIRSMDQMLADDVTNPITADGFLAHGELVGRQARARAEFDLSVWESIPDYDESGKPYKGTVVPEEPKPCCGVDEDGNEYFCDEDQPVTVAGGVTRSQRIIERLLDRLRP